MDIQAEKIELIKLLTEVKSKTVILKIKDILKSEKTDETEAIASNPVMKKKLDKSISQINDGNYKVIKTEDLWKNTPFIGIGKPEPLKHNWKGYWSRRINKEHRVIYKVDSDRIYIASLRDHYADK